jgi:hypothetical protein
VQPGENFPEYSLGHLTVPSRIAAQLFCEIR